MKKPTPIDEPEEDEEEEQSEINLNQLLQRIVQNQELLENKLNYLYKNQQEAQFKQLSIGDLHLVSKNPIRDLNRLFKNQKVISLLEISKFKKTIKELPSYLE